ncbi:MAG: 30S ribosomal protein S20 [Gammaproteobacteria bacterium WSBS_2016_MAG_OTU1]
MANSKQSEKRARQNRTRRIRGQAIRSHYRTMVKKVRAAATGSDADGFRAAYITMQAAADSAVSKNLLHRNTVSRIKSRLNRLSPTAKSATPAIK